MSTPSHLLSVSIGFDPKARKWVFEEVSFNDLEPYCFGEKNEGFPVNAEEGLRAIGLLALLVKRARTRDLSNRIPTGLRATVDPYWNSKAGAGWPAILFGENPWKTYIHGHTKSGDLFLDLDDSIEIEIHFMDLKTGQHPPTIDDVILQFRTPAKGAEIEDPLIINVRKAGQVISSIEQRGSLRPKTQIRVEITAPIAESLCVFWIDSGNNGFFPLYPEIDSRLKLTSEEACAFGGDDDFKTYQIPAKKTVGISGTGGIETCLVLRRRASFDEEVRATIQDTIQEVVELRNPSSFIESPQYRFGTSENFRNMERQASETRLEAGWQIEEWEAQLAEKMAPHYEWLHLFHIPNPGSQVT